MTRYELDTSSAAGEGRLSIHFNRPETLLIRTEEETLNIGFSVKTSHRSHEASIRDEAHIIIRPAARLTHQELIDRYMRLVQNLLTFATDTPNAVDNVVLSGMRTGQSPSDWGNKFHFAFRPIFEIKKKQDALAPGTCYSPSPSRKRLDSISSKVGPSSRENMKPFARSTSPPCMPSRATSTKGPCG